MDVEDPSDGDIEAVLLAAPASAWSALAAAARALAQAEGALGTWRGGERLADGSISMPWMETDGVVLDAAAAVGGVGAVVVFAWPSWPGLDRYRTPASFAGAPVADVARALTAMIRSDRFSEGSLVAAAEDGLLLAAIRRLLAWRAATP